MKEKLELPVNVKNVLDVIHRAGYEAYVVGGCVRDALLGREPEDWDITTSAKPGEVKRLFGRTFDTGIKHGTITVLFGQDHFEVTTYRIDGEYGDGRHPDNVLFVTSLAEDLKRRDFTINAMAYNEEEGLIDLHGGREDLESKLIRAVGDPMERFEEDALRMLRAIRFMAQLDFTLEMETMTAIPIMAHRLSMVSMERIQTELKKLVCSEHPQYLQFACYLGLTEIFLPEFNACMECPQNNPHHCFPVGVHILTAMRAFDVKGDFIKKEIGVNSAPKAMRITKDQILPIRLALLFHDIAKPLTRTTDKEGIDHFKGHARMGAEIAKEALKRLKFDNKTIELTALLVRHHEIRTPMSDRELRRLMAAVGNENMPMLLHVCNADIWAQSDYMRDEKLAGLLEINLRVERIRENRDPLSVRDLKISGRDLIAMGVPQGRSIGIILATLLGEVLDAPQLNEENYLRERAAMLWEKERK